MTSSSEYAQPFSLLVVADLLGVPESDHAELRRQDGGEGPGRGDRPADRRSTSWTHLEDFFTSYIEARRREPQDDVLGKMAQAAFADGSIPEVIEVVRVATILFAGGQGTAARFLGNMVKIIAEDPALQELLASGARSNPGLRRRDAPTATARSRRTSAWRAIRRPSEASTSLPAPASYSSSGPPTVTIAGSNVRRSSTWTVPMYASTSPSVAVSIHAPALRSCEPTAGSPSSECSTVSPEHSRSQMPGTVPRKPAATDYTPTYILRGVEALHIEFASTR